MPFTDAPVSPSVARTINGEMVVLLGWGRAILMQLAHPLVAQGVSDHSLFGREAGQYVQRVRRTVGAMLTLTFGTDEEARAVAARINAIHARVEGTLQTAAGIYPAGTPYSARDPELLLWVHATLIDSLPLAYEQFVGPLTEAQKDGYCAEAAAAAPLLDLPERMTPASVSALQAYMRAMTEGGAIEVTEPARRIAGLLLAPPIGVAAPFYRLARLATIGLLPPAIRDGYGFTWTAQQDRRLRRLSAAIRRVRSLTPRVVHEWPSARRFQAAPPLDPLVDTRRGEA